MIDSETMNFLDGYNWDNTSTTATVNNDPPVQLKFTKVRNVKSPNKAYSAAAAGIDFYVPYFDYDFINAIKEANQYVETEYWNEVGEDEDGKYFTIAPHSRIAIPSGIKVHFEVPGTVLIAFNKSGMATKYGLTVGACVIDGDYLGEVHLSLINTSDEDVRIHEGQKVSQFIYMPIIYPGTMKEISNEEYSKYHTDRGEGKFASSGEK